MVALGKKHKLSFSTQDTDVSGDVLAPRELVRQVRKMLNEDAILSLDNGLYKVWFARNYETYFPNTLLLDNALATMGAGYSCGMMAALEYPGRQVVTVTGDGGLVMNL
jgi:acetolactate synthase-1/2/3 large subunit